MDMGDDDDDEEEDFEESPETDLGSLPADDDEDDEESHKTPTPSPAAILDSSIIIFHPGSKYLRVGRASDSEPVTVLHAIARRCTKATSAVSTKGVSPASPTWSYQDSIFPLLGNRLPVPPEVESARLQLCHTLQTSLKLDGSPRFATPTETVAGYNKVDKGIVDEGSREPAHWKDYYKDSSVIVGDEVLKLNPSEDFNIHFPWRRGQLNIHKGIGGSLQAVMADLKTIWTYGVVDILEIDTKCLKEFQAVVVIPAMFDKLHGKELLNLTLNEMGFGSALLIQDHVAATFGNGLACATVVDVGDQKISVSCVEDGVSLPQSRIELKYGGGDLTVALWTLMKQAAVPIPVNLESTWDFEFLNDFKENFCHFDLNKCGPEERTIVWNKPGTPIIKYKIYLGDELLIVPLSYFNPDLLRGSIGKYAVVVNRSQSAVSEDPFDAAYINETSRRGLKETDEGDDDEIEDTKEDNLTQHSKVDTDKLLGIDQAVFQSIESCNLGDEVKRRLYSCILVVGGGFKFEGLGEWLNNKISMNIPRLFKSDSIEVITSPKDGDPSLTSWKGASVLVKLETAAELGITKHEWNTFGIRIMRERSLCYF